MASAEITIIVNEGESLADAFQQLMGYTPGPSAEVDDEPDPVPVSASQDAEARPTQRRRGRPPKNTVADPTATAEAAASGASESTSSEPTIGSATGQSEVDPFQDTSSVLPASPPSHPAGPVVAMIDVQAAAREHAKAHSMKSTQDLLEANFKDGDGAPVRQLSKLQPGDYAKAVELLAV